MDPRSKPSASRVLPNLLTAGLFVVVLDAIGPFWSMAMLFAALMAVFAAPWIRACWDMLFGS